MLLRNLLVPLLALVAHRAVLASVAFACGYDPFSAASWTRWDSAFYLDIANDGYRKPTHCPPESHYPADAWCGNTAWFPGYPYAIRAASRWTGADSAAVAVWLSAVAQFVSLCAIWSMLKGPHRFATLTMAAFFPGNIYYAAVFPTSLCMCFTVLCLVLCARSRFGLASVSAVGAAVSYPTGALLAPILIAWSFFARKRGALVVAAASLFGLATVFVLMHRETGEWDAFIRLQAKYSYMGNALDTYLAHLKPIINGKYRDAKGFWTGLQTLLCLVIVFVACGMAARIRSSLAFLIAADVCAFWIAPLILGGRLSLYRSEALLMPAVVLVDLVPHRFRQEALAAVCVLLSIPMAALFFRQVLV